VNAIEEEFTDDQLRHALTEGYADIPLFSKLILSLELHPGQIAWLERSTKRENLLVTGNRWGKSLVSAVKLLHHALYRPRLLSYDQSGRYRALCASITQEQAGIVFANVQRLIQRSSLVESLVDDIVMTPYPKVTFGNGATIEARSTQNRGEYLLGQDYDLIVFDEVAFDPAAEYVVEEVMSMRLADRNGRLDLVSTPNGKNWLYQRAMQIASGTLPGYLHYGDTRENTHLSQEYVDDRVRYLSDSRVEQNIRGQFVDSGGEVIPGAHIDRALSRGSDALQTDSVRYITGYDLARKRTATVGITVAVSGNVVKVVMLERFKGIDWPVVLTKIRARHEEFGGTLLIDATGLGDVITQELADLQPEAVIFTPQRKAELLTNLELLHAQDRIIYERWELPDGSGKSWSLEDELRRARWDSNSDCDALMALALAVWPMRRRDQFTPLPRIGYV
jgi:hypothetical protein